MDLTVIYYHVTYPFQSEFTLFIFLNVKEVLARSRDEFSGVTDCSWTINHKHLLRKWIFWRNLPNDWAELWVLNSTVHLTVCYCHVTYAFQSEFTLFIYLNVNELLGRNRRNIRRLSDCNTTRTHNHLARKRKLNHSAKLMKWLSRVMSTYLSGAFHGML